jgi:hypothetical protein
VATSQAHRSVAHRKDSYRFPRAGDTQPCAAAPNGAAFTKVGRARDRLAGMPRRTDDEEEVALSAFDSSCRAAGRGSFPRLQGQQRGSALPGSSV